MSTSPNKTSVCDELGEQVAKNMIYSYGEKVMLCKYNNCEKPPDAVVTRPSVFEHICVCVKQMGGYKFFYFRSCFSNFLCATCF